MKSTYMGNKSTMCFLLNYYGWQKRKVGSFVYSNVVHQVHPCNALVPSEGVAFNFP